MERTLDKGEDKIQKICDALRRETLEPAKSEAQRIEREAKSRAEDILREARELAEKHLEAARQKIEQERNVFHSSLQQAGKQSLEELRQRIENKLFNNELVKAVEKETADPKVVARIITTILSAIEKEGLSKELEAVIPEAVSVKEVNGYLAKGMLDKLKNGGVVLDDFGGGAKVKVHDKKITIELTDEVLIELLSRYVRKDFRKLLFQN